MVKWNDLGVSSQTDFILTKAKDRRKTTDARPITSINLDTDHRPVIMTLKQRMWRNKRAKHRPEERINLRVLNEEETKPKKKQKQKNKQTKNKKIEEEPGKTLTGIDTMPYPWMKPGPSLKHTR